MRLRSVLVVLSLLALVAGPADAAKQSRSARQKKAAALKRASAARQKKVKPTTGTQKATGTIGGTRKGAQQTGAGLPRKEAVVASSGAPKKTARPQSRAGVTGQQHHRDSGAVPTSIASARTFDSSAAVGPRKKPGRVKRWVTGLFLAAAVAVGGYGWHAADMNTKVGDAWSYIEHVIGDATHQGGGGHTTPIPPVPDPGPQPPWPDPGPPTPPGPDNNTPGPSGGHGHQTPHHPETDHR